MSDTRVLLEKIRELRQRLAQVQGLVGEANRAAATLLGDDSSMAGGAGLDEQIEEGSRRQALLDASMRQLAEGISGNEIRPTRLTGRARHLLERGRQLVAKLKALADEPLLSRGDPAGDDALNDALLDSFRDTASMTESALRLVQAFPDAPSAQLRLSDGLEHITDAIADRLALLTEAVDIRRGEIQRRDLLANLLLRLKEGEQLEPEPFVELAESLLEEVRQGAPLRFLSAPANNPAAFVACHGITAARVAARMIRHDPDWQKFALDAVIASLVKDVGMLTVEPDLLAHDGKLADEDVRQIEGHVRVGTELVAKNLPAAAPLCEAVMSHHERLTGTGYPAGLRDGQVGMMPRLLAIADVYAAMCCPRPHRSALDPRTALTETLQLAERGLLDRMLAERLLHLSFYPVGSLVELADGSVGLVVATHLVPRQLQTPGRPVIAMLADGEGRLLPTPRHLDLAESEGRTIVRALDGTRRRQLLGKRHPELV
jgi:hypothetical protein